jgi:hypothetical protein
LQGHDDRLLYIAFCPNGQRVVTASADKTAKVWEVANSNYVFTLSTHTDAVRAAVFSPDGRRIATASADHTAKVWDAANGRELLTFRKHTGLVFSIAFSPDGKRLITGGADETARVWDADSGTERLKLTGHNGAVLDVAFSADGRRIVTSGFDSTAKLWDAASGEELLAFKGHTKQVYSAAFSPDGQRIVTTSEDKTAKVWDAATANQVTMWQREEDQATGRLELLRHDQAAAAERARALRAQDPGGVNQWLVMGPLDCTAQGLQALDQEQIPHESTLHPREQERFQVGEADYAWRAHRLDDYVLDLSDANSVRGRHSVAYAVCYIETDTNLSGLRMKVGTDDLYKLYLNGKEIYRQAHRRSHVLDQDVIGVELKSGLNVLVLKLVRLHEALYSGPGWRASVHFTDAAGQPAKGIRVSLTQP